MTSSDVWDEARAERYDAGLGGMADPTLLDRTVDVLAELAGDGTALEMAIGTGRVALPLLERGVAVSGIELSAPMVAVLRRRVGPDRLPVTLGDMATARLPGRFTLVYLVFNTIGNLCTQDEQVACFANAAAHLAPGGRFVVENGVPPLRRLPSGQTGVPFAIDKDHTGLDTLDVVTQRATSHHYTREVDGRHRHVAHHYRYVWPAELDLMARLAGLELEHRWADWQRRPFTAESESHVSVWRAPA